MPRNRYVWHVFAGCCAIVAATAAAAFWIASIQFAGLADAALRDRLADAGRGLAAATAGAGGTVDRVAFENGARRLRESSRIDCRLLDATGGDETAMAARGGGVTSHSRYDSGSGRRSLEVAMPLPSSPPSVILVTADAADSDRQLAEWQRTLLLGCLVVTAAAAAIVYGLARQLARPVDSLRAAAARIASGDVSADPPATDVAEFADIAAALVRLREQLVERGLTIGRQDTQQEAVLGSMIEGVLAIDGRRRILGINRAAADLLDVETEQTAGRPLQDVIRNPDLRRFALTAIDCREPVEDDLLLRGVRDRTIRLRGTALRDASGDGGAVIVLNDVTEVQRLENVRRDFVANVSHELKTPVASIKGFVETLLDGALDDRDDARRFLGIVARQADRLATIIEDLLALSRIEQSETSGKLPLDQLPLSGILITASDDCRPRAVERSIRLEVECPPDLTVTVNGPLLEQAVINLVDNAIKYSESGKTVWLSAEDDATGPAIRVRDEGCGIAEEHLPRLFERFYRVDKARSRNLGGTGLGLSIVKHIVQAHAGTIVVESTPGVGTTFTIRLPTP
ncbi:MAG: HAMP domain-containing protein [Planctomycetota bacterium]|jgi:two-component system phosphate regulon sensor histidine kinase PhoR|nr:MAG: HAMP domain-containing protein [Planctomycetota bacterium]